MAKRTRAEILRLIDDNRPSPSLVKRYEDDYALYHLDEYDAGEGYQSYTSSAPKVFADKIISFIVKSSTILRVPRRQANVHARSAEGENGDVDAARKVDETKERFAIGVLRAVDECLMRTGVPPVKDQWGFYATVRGGPVMGRALLVKRVKQVEDSDEEETETFPEILPWDPLHVSYQRGYDGLLWAAYTTEMTRAEIKSEYGVTIPSDSQSDGEPVSVHHFYDAEDSFTLTEDKWLKRRTRHGSPRVPVVFASVGAQPIVRSNAGRSDDSENNESVFKSMRATNDKNNFIHSILLELAGRMREPSWKVFSADGTKTLDEDPSKSGSELSLARDREDVQQLQPVESTRDVAAVLGLISGEQQRATLPNSLYGELPFQLSGFAIGQLRQGAETPLDPALNAVTEALRQSVNLLTDQYMTDQYDTLNLSGEDRMRHYFSEEITPQMLRKGGDYQIKLSPQLPRDDPAKYAMAQMAKELQLPQDFIWDEILEIQDTDNFMDRIMLDIGMRGMPEAGMWEISQAMLRQGRPDLAQMYFMQFLSLIHI